MQYIININFHDFFYQYVLPTEQNRSYDIDLSDYKNLTGIHFTLEYFDTIWRIVSNDTVSVIEAGRKVTGAFLTENKLVFGKTAVGADFSILLSPLSDEYLQYSKYDISGISDITIGKENADLCLNSDYISHRHAVMSFQNGCWMIEDFSKNGIFLNSERLLSGQKIQLHPFDVLYTGGFQLLFTGNILAVNHQRYVKTNLPQCRTIDVHSEQRVSFEHLPYMRSPRILEPLADDVIEIEAPPAKQSRKKQPMLFVLGPAVTTPIPMLTTMMLRMGMSNSAGSYWIMGVSVLMSSAIGLGWTLARKRYDAKDETETENTRVSAYESYLNKNERLLSERHAESREKLLKQYPSSEDIVSMFDENHLNEFLWNRNVRFRDFTSVRLGTGRMEIPGKIQIPKERFSVYNDELAERPAALKESYHIIKQVPSLVCLRENKINGLIGDKERIDEIANNIAVQLSALHSYTDVRMAFIYGKKEETQYSWARWLPHVFSPDKKVRLHGNDEDSAHHTLSYLTEIIKSRTEAAESHDSERRVKLPYYIVFCTQPELLYNHAIYRYMTDSTDCGFTFILVYPRMEQLPNECRFLIQADAAYTGCYSVDQTRDETNIVNFDYITSEKAEQIARQMSRYWVNEIADGEIPERIDFLEMYGISDVHEWDLLKHWKENRTYENIRAQIGVTYGNKPVYLDIHEKYHGPHGLIAGTTGSGKSETIQTFILSLMLNYHPDEVAFVLIDYKGGGMANLFAGTPHLAGTITNISASDEQSDDGGDTYQTGRALLSLKSEIKRRQKIFNDYSINHIDAYNRLFREKEAEEPLPHLILISDEFAELKKEQPEFMKELVSTARVGRSLGIHLILATQKPAGVVDDEIWSNARFKLCLKVQDRSDSMGMLKRPEAAELTRTGQGYLQIGSDEIFEMFQSGYSGAAYQPEVNMAEAANSTVEVLSRDGIRTRKRSAVKKGGKKVSQLETCVRYISEISAKNGIAPVKKLWLPMFDGNLPLETLFAAEALHNTCTAIIGKLDYPEQQSQPLFTLKYPQCGHVMIAGNSGSGKSTLMKTILYSLMCGQTAEYINWYALDFSNRMFDDLQPYEHCGGIVYGEDEDKVKRVFRLLNETLQYRKNKLADAGVSSVEEYRRKSANPMPYILVLIDNYAGFKEAYEAYTDTMITLLREGVSRGIHFIVTLNALSDIPAKCRQYFSTRLPLILNERMDYHDYLYCTPTVPVLPYPGSGLIQYNESIVQFQTAYISEPRKYASLIQKSDSGFQAKKLRFIDKKQNYAAFASTVADTPLSVPLGWHTNDIEPYSISLWDTFCYFISDTDGEGAQSMLKNILLYAKTHSLETYLIGDVQGQEEYGQSMAEYHEYSDVLAFMTSLGAVFKERSTARKAYIAEYGNTGLNEYMQKNFRPILIVFGDYNEFCDMTYGNSAAGEMRYDTFFETILKQGRNFGITMIAHWTPQINTVNYLKPASQLFASYKTGIHLGGKLSTQKLISANTSPYSVKASAPELGYSLEGGRISEVYIPPHAVREDF